MMLNERLDMVRRYGPPSSTLRLILLILATYDTDAGAAVFGGRLEAETGLKERCIRYSLKELVRLGWLVPEKAAAGDDPRTAGRVHGHLGGRQPADKNGVSHGCKTRYRIAYQSAVPPLPRGHDVPPQGGTTCREVIPESDSRGHDVPSRGHDVPFKGARHAPDPRGIHNGSGGGEGYPPPRGSPGEGGPAAGPPPAAVAAGSLAPAARDILAAARKLGCIPDDDWLPVLSAAGCRSPEEVPGLLWRMKSRCEIDHGPRRPPYRASDFAPYAGEVRAAIEKFLAVCSRLKNPPAQRATA